MLQNEFKTPNQTDGEPPDTRIGNIAAMLRIMRPLNGSLPDPTVGRRRLLADLCRFIGVKVGTLPADALGLTPASNAAPVTETTPASASVAAESNADPAPSSELSPRLEQTLRHLLNGDSEKQVARKLALSQHTVHVYVKALYRRFGVSSRAELLARHLKR